MYVPAIAPDSADRVDHRWNGAAVRPDFLSGASGRSAGRDRRAPAHARRPGHRDTRSRRRPERRHEPAAALGSGRVHHAGHLRRAARAGWAGASHIGDVPNGRLPTAPDLIAATRAGQAATGLVAAGVDEELRLLVTPVRAGGHTIALLIAAESIEPLERTLAQARAL